MTISKKWQAAAAGALALALVGGGAGAANAAPGDPLNPQPDGTAAAGSKGGFFLFDGNTGEPADSNGTRVYAKDETIIGSASATDVDAEINAAASRPVTGATTFTGVYAFLAKKNSTDLMGGINTWNAYHVDAAAGPNGGTLQPALTLESFVDGPGGIADDIAAGGTYWYGIAYTNLNGVQVAGAVYREITIEPGTGNYTVTPSVLETEAPAWAPDFAGYTQNGSAMLRNGNVELQAGAGNAGKTVDVYAEGTAAPVHTGIVLDASGNAIVTSSIAAGTRLAIADTAAETVLAWATATGFVLAQPVAGDPNQVTIENPAEGETVVTIAAGAANANQTFTAVGWSNPTTIGQVTTDADGNAIVDAAVLGTGDHTIALVNANDEIVAWGTVTLVNGPNVSETDITVDVSTSNRFELSGVRTSVNLGTVRRGATTAPAALGAFTVIDDRDLLPGWTLNAEVSDFVNAEAGGDVIQKSALGLAPKQVGTAVPGISLGAAQSAGSGTYSALFAEGAAESSTLEAGTQFDADLTFAAPSKAKKGTYTSTLTLTLASK
ncbi:hypothetical protein [Microbacterium cremeum]|uniref:hypothetical protein n=1 Tax=Microbacterium cremeum TaxID=2782169 RepID=UPI001888273C|nr:hypothetical protein [Microbacterium cremeum]